MPTEQPLLHTEDSLKSEPALEDLTGKRILVVEDEGIIQVQIRKALTYAGLIVAGSAGSGPEGVALARETQPDIVLMDIRMPGVYDGIEAARRILESRPTCVIMLTAFAGSEYQEQAQQIGASGYIVKPITASVLLPGIRQAWLRFLRGETASASVTGEKP